MSKKKISQELVTRQRHNRINPSGVTGAENDVNLFFQMQLLFLNTIFVFISGNAI